MNKNSRKKNRIDYSSLYNKKFLEDLDPESYSEIMGIQDGKEPKPRGQLLGEIKQHMEGNLRKIFFCQDAKDIVLKKSEVWQQGYVSTDVAEDNDSDKGDDAGDDESSYYDDEEEEEEEEKTDPEALIKDEIENKNIPPEEKAFLENQSELEKQIIK